MNPDIHPGQTEICGNAFDDNCNGEIDESCVATAIFFVDRDPSRCSDEHEGTQARPWCTIGKANETLLPGQTVYLRGGTYTGDHIEPVNSGTSDNARITYSNYADETVTIEGASYAIRIVDRSYISVIGIKFKNCQRNLYISASDRINIGFCEFDNPAGPHTWAGSRIYDGSTYNKIYHSTFSRWGSQSGSGGDYQDHGAILDIGRDAQVDTSDYNLVVNCTFFYGGHHILGVYANYNVVRGNTFHNEEWYDCHRSDIGGLCGNRNVILNSSQPDKNVRNVIEHNMIAFSGVPPDQVASAGLSVRTRSNIIRRNIFAHNDSSGLALSVDGNNNNDASDNHIYHNVFYKNGFMLLDTWDPRRNGLMFARWVDSAGYNDISGVAVKNNIFFQNHKRSISYYNVAEDDQTVADNWDDMGDPLFVDVSTEVDPFELGSLDFSLQQGSPCLDMGGFLTHTTSAGSGTTLKVEDAGYFTDGFNVIGGDLVQLEGQTTVARIEGVDYVNNTISVDRPLSWNAGQGLTLPHAGSRPDQGAYELFDRNAF